MSKYLFGDLVHEVKEKVDRQNNPYEFFIAGDHMDTDELHLLRRGTFAGSDVGPAFIRVFKPGQVLYGSRRTYLRKVAVADFEGVTANTTFVLETKNESILIQQLLPFIMQSERFVQHSIKRSKGSTNPYVLFSDLCDYEIDLPNIETQKRLAEVLWTMDEVRMAYKKLIAATDEQVKSQFIEIFGNLLTNDKMWPEYKLGDISTSRLGKMLDSKKQTGKYLHPYLANVNVQWFRFDLENLNLMDFDEVAQSEFELRPRDLLVCEGGEIGRCAIWTGELQDCYYQKAIHRVRCNESIIIPEYLAHLFYYHSQINGFSDVVGNKVTIAHLPGDKLKAMRVMVPPLPLQKQFAAFVQQSDKSKFELEQALSELTTTYKRIISEQLG